MTIKTLLEKLRTSAHTEITVQLSSDIEKSMDDLFFEIKKCKNLEEADQYFKILGTIHFELAKLAFKYRIELVDKLRKFVADFDRLDDTKYKEYLFKKIQLGQWEAIDYKKYILEN